MSVCHICHSGIFFVECHIDKRKNKTMATGKINVSVENIFPLIKKFLLQNAASIAALFLTTEAVVADKPEKSAAPAGDPTGGMGGMDF